MKKRTPTNAFQPGNPGGPGRPRGSRNRLSEAFLTALCEDFQTNGPAAIIAAREADPLGYVKVVAGMVPQKLEVARSIEEMTTEELTAIAEGGKGGASLH